MRRTAAKAAAPPAAGPKRAEPAKQLFADPSPPARPEPPLPRDLVVVTSGEELMRWNPRRIVEVLVREARIDPPLAEQISREIETTLRRSGLHTVSTGVLRELVGAELVSRGLTGAWSRHTRLGASLFDVGTLLLGGQETSHGRVNPAASPERTALLLGGRIKRDYSLSAVLSERVADAQRRGDLHVHDLEQIDRLASLSLAPGALAELAGGGRDPELFINRLLQLVGRLGEVVSGPIGIPALNQVLAGPLAARSDAEIARLATRVVAELGEASRRAGLAVEVGLSWALPGEKPAEATAGHRVARALLKSRRGLEAPTWLVPVEPDLFRASGHLAFLESAAQAAAESGGVRFLLGRGGDASGRAPGDRPKVVARAPAVAVLARVTLSLPRLGYRAGADLEEVETRLVAVLELAARAHMEKRVFLEQMLARGERGPLGALFETGGIPRFKLEDALHPILLSGLNELVEEIEGRPLHLGEQALATGLRLLATAGREVARLARRHKLRLGLGADPGFATAARFARLDLRHHSPQAGRHLKGDLRRGRVRYTPGVGLDPAAHIGLRQRLEIEGRLHQLLPQGAVTYLSAEALAGASGLLEAYNRSRCFEIQALPDQS